jgi:hypothetical protein
MKSLAVVLLSCSAAFAQMPSDPEIRKILIERVGPENTGISVVAGHPDYDLMTAEFADAARKQAEQMKTAVGGMGALQSVTFKGVGQGGMDIYEVLFEHGKSEWRISLASDGKTSGLLYRKL